MNNKNAFTLVELIVVMAIIAILSLILVPTFSGFMKSAQITKANANAKSVHTVVSAVITDHINTNASLTQQVMGDLINSSNLSSVSIGGEDFNLKDYLDGMNGTACVMLNIYGTGVDFVTWTIDPYFSPSTQVIKADQKSNPYGTTAVFGGNVVGCYPLG